MKILQIAEPLYDCSIEYIFDCTPTELHTYLQKKHGEGYEMWNQGEGDKGEIDNSTDGMQFHVPGMMGQNEVFYVWLNEPTLNTLFHETLHLVFDILVERGIEYDASCEDAFAYLGGYVFEEVGKQLGMTFKI